MPGTAKLRRASFTLLSLVLVGCGGKTVDNDLPESATPSACPQQVGSKPIAHACSHTTNGPFENVVASRSRDAAPTVDAIHVSYLINLPATGHGYVVFTPSRRGEHLLLLDSPSPLTVELDGAVQTPLFSEAIAGCETANFGEVYELARGERYLVEFEPDGESPRLLFFEHLATFGDGAWQEGCLENE